MTDASAERGERRARLAVAGAIALGVLLRLVAVRAQGFPTDVGTFEAWATRLAQLGPGRFYEPGYFSDYPPAFLYVLWALGAHLDGEALRLAVKAISIPADIGLAVLAAAVVWRTGGRAAGVAAAVLWSLAPGQIFAGPYWGQVDAVGTLPLFASLVAAGARRWWLAGALAAIAALVKPQFGIALLIVAVAVGIEFVRSARWQAAVAFVLSAFATAYLLCAPFWGPDPRRIAAELLTLVRGAAETYPYTSLYAFNGWSIFFDFWKPDDALVGIGAALLLAGLIASCVPLWWRRDTAALLACALFAALAFYFLPTRAHERYLFPAFALAVPFAATRKRILPAYLVFAVAFALTLYFAFTRYEQYVDLRVPALLEATVFSRTGQIAIALAMIGSAAYLVWRVAFRDASLTADIRWGVPSTAAPGATWTLPRGLSPGGLPTRRDLVVALLVALALLITRGYRLDWPRDMYFDEVYHARTAFELLAQREPYEWTHPHLAKEIMALGIIAFGDDRVVARESGLGAATVFAVTNDGSRIFAGDDGNVQIRDREGRGGLLTRATGAVRALAISAHGALVATDRDVCEISVPDAASRAATSVPLSFDRCVASPFARTLALAATADHVYLAGAGTGVAIWTDLSGSPQRYAGEVAALTAKPDGSELYVLDPRGVIHVVAPDTAEEKRTLIGGGPASAIAYAQGPNRLLIARADAPLLESFDLEGGAHDTVPLSNVRTGSYRSGATRLAVVTRTDFLYALADGRLVVVETHGTSPFAAIPVQGTLIGIDGEADKLLVAGPDGADLVETGRHAIAWRIPGVLFAAVLAFFLVLLARRLFASPVLPALVGIAVLADGSMFAQARIGMNDVYVAALIVAAWYFIVAAHSPRRSSTLDIVIAGICLGLAAATKWAAFYALAGVAIASVAVTARAYERGRPGSGGPLDLLAGRGLNAALLLGAFAVLPLAIYLASYARWFGGPTIPYSWNLIELTQQMYWYHSSLTAPHPAGSPWWSWPLVLKPVYWYFGQAGGGDNAYIYDAGNVVLFWAGIVAFGWCALAALRARSLPLGFVVFAALVQYVAWIPIGRVLFFYHFFTALPFYLLSLGAALAYLWETRRERLVIGYLAVAVGAFAYFYPFTSAQPFPGAQAGMFFILPSWTYDCQFYPTFVCHPTIVATPLAALLGRLALSLAIAGAAAIVFFAVAPSALARVALAPLRRSVTAPAEGRRTEAPSPSGPSSAHSRR